MGGWGGGGEPAGSRCLNALDLHGSSGKQDNERTKQPIRDQNDKYLHQSEARMHGFRSSQIIANGKKNDAVERNNPIRAQSNQI